LKRRVSTVQPLQEVNHEEVDAADESKKRIKLCNIKVPIQIFAYLATVANVEVDDEGGMDKDEGSRTELNSHANMPVVGRHAYIISDTGRMADVSPFTPPDFKSMRLCIVDAAVQYDCPYDGQSYILKHPLCSFNEKKPATAIHSATSRDQAE
jgi:hypothetical protein